MRVSREMLTKQFERTVSAALEVGITEADRWHLESGSKTNGLAYRIWLAHENYEAGLRGEMSEGEEWHTGHYAPIIDGHLGMTANEARRTLYAYTSAFRAVTYCQRAR